MHSHRFGLALAAAALLVVGACSGKDDGATTTTTGSTVPPETTTTIEVPIQFGQQLYVWTPTPGECFDKRRPDPTKPDEVVLKLDCKLPHSYEIFGTVDLPTKDFPGDVFMTELGKKECWKQFKPFVGSAYETSSLDMGYYVPTQGSWGQSNRHVIGCYVFEEGKKLEGTKKGANA